MAQSGAWFENVLSWWFKAFWIDPALYALGVFLSIFGEFGFALQTNIDATTFLKYPQLTTEFSRRWKGSGAQKKYERKINYDANYEYSWGDVTGTKGLTGLVTVEQFKKKLKDSGKGLTDKQIDALADWVDKDNNGMINFNEFLAKLKG